MSLVVADQLHDGNRHLTLRSQDGSTFLVPSWMIEAQASSVKIIDAPRLSVARLLVLRALVDSVLASQAGEETADMIMRSGGSGLYELYNLLCACPV